MHLDLYSGAAADLERLVGLGAAWVRAEDDPDET